METTRLSSKGQVVLPSHIRSAHQWQPGVEFSVEDTPDGPAKTAEEMDAAIAAGIKAHDDRVDTSTSV